MKTKTNKTRAIASALILSLCTSLALAPAAQAGSQFNAAEIERTITEFYDFYGTNGTDGTEGPLSATDKNEMANAIADEIGKLEPTAFNDVMGHLAADYGSNPAHRAAIELMMGHTHNAIAAELLENRSSHPLLTVLDDVFAVWTVAYTFGFGKGLWASRGSGLKGIERFKHVVKSVSSNLPRGRRAALTIAGIGTGIGIIHAVFNHLETKKLDPKEVLNAAQSGVVQKLGEDMARLRDELRALQQTATPAQAPSIRSRLREADASLSKAQGELEKLYEAAPQFRSRMQPIAEDLQESRGLLARIGLKIDAGGPVPVGLP